VGQAWAHEQETEGPAGRGLALCLAGVVGRTVTIVEGSAFGQSWDWDTLGAVAGLQAERIAHTLDEDGAGDHGG
jgi:hypothetical protein